MTRPFPFLSQAQSLVLLRVCLAGIFLAHSIVRVSNGTIPRFAGYLENKGLPQGMALVWGITVFEVTGGVLLLLGYFTRIISAGFILMLIGGIILIHAEKGWFTGEHGSGGIEYSFVLIIAFLVTAAAKK
ncbi:DoxX family protein [Chitinophaga barathri]|uniref:DoxX family protein n=1 Tax=Chitinophaga barathri TaxID=1647451 RepID=A0A3N4MJI1_9BACT|nr:DoxX family protein [Chitinophaga barathri]RPD42017.1 DoxX family protein [Chitinophaga barathri]